MNTITPTIKQFWSRTKILLRVVVSESRYNLRIGCHNVQSNGSMASGRILPEAIYAKHCSR